MPSKTFLFWSDLNNDSVVLQTLVGPHGTFIFVSIFSRRIAGLSSVVVLALDKYLSLEIVILDSQLIEWQGSESDIIN